jgi:hypothetical protein
MNGCTNTSRVVECREGWHELSGLLRAVSDVEVGAISAGSGVSSALKGVLGLLGFG